jgi:hypothetical protein
MARLPIARLNAQRPIRRLEGSTGTLGDPSDASGRQIERPAFQGKMPGRGAVETRPFDRTPVLSDDSCVIPKRGHTVERPERPLPTPAPDPRRSGPIPAVTSATSAAQAAQHAAVRERREIKNQVLSRTSTASLVGRASSMRRMRRRTLHTTRPYCRTNGCASFLEVDPTTGTASCPICGYVLRPH